MWWAVTIRIGGGDAEDLAGDLACGSGGVELTPDGDGMRLSIYTASRTEAEQIAGAAGTIMKTRGLAAGLESIGIEEVEDGRWVERYQSRLRPFPLGERFLVVPGAESPAGSDRIPIVLVPGRAFGTGEHPTTRLCIEELERRVRPGSAWFDLGTGTGILAIVAAACGAEPVHASDTDPDAVEVAGEVLRANGMDGRIDLFPGSAEAMEPRSVDGIVANIAAPFFVAHADDLRSTLRDGGILLATGFLRSDVPEVTAALEDGGLTVIGEREMAGWALLTAAPEGVDEST